MMDEWGLIQCEIERRFDMIIIFGNRQIFDDLETPEILLI